MGVISVIAGYRSNYMTIVHFQKYLMNYIYIEMILVLSLNLRYASLVYF